eukprot:1064126-Pleurochrysis_carterae.AAC.1
MRDRAAELEVKARRETRAWVSLQEVAVFSALADFERWGDKSSITHTYQTLTTFMRLPSASGRGVLGEDALMKRPQPPYRDSAPHTLH